MAPTDWLLKLGHPWKLSARGRWILHGPQIAWPAWRRPQQLGPTDWLRIRWVYVEVHTTTLVRV